MEVEQENRIDECLFQEMGESESGLVLEAGLTRRIMTWNNLLNWQEQAKAA